VKDVIEGTIGFAQVLPGAEGQIAVGIQLFLRGQEYVVCPGGRGGLWNCAKRH